VSDPYYRQRLDRMLIDQENERARRLVVLDDALTHVLAFDKRPLGADGRATLRAALIVVLRLRRTS